jgi:glycosyltransferase involved in cell wall biosynthesis
MRVLHILDSLNRGGAETMELDVCRNAAACGLELTFVATGGGDLEEEFRASGAEFIRLERKLPVDPWLARQLRRIIHERGIQVAHGHQPVEALHLYLATRGSDVKRVLTLHGLYSGKKSAWALDFLLPRMDARVTVSDELRRWMARGQGAAGEANFTTVRNGVDPKRLCPSGAPGLRKELGLADGTLLMGMVGNFYADGPKDQLTVCRALPEVLERNAAAAFVFAGGRSEAAPRLYDDCVSFCREKGIAGRVHFLGRRTDIADVLRSLDVFVLSSFREGAPIAVIEAMMMGIPAVLSDIGALREVSGDGQHAILFKSGDAEDLAAKLGELLRDANARARLGAEGREWALGQFGIEKHIGNLIALYERLAA